MTDIHKTLQAVRALTAPSREVDAMIHAFVLGGTYRPTIDGSGYLIIVKGLQHGISKAALPRYTSSVDASKALMPEGQTVHIIAHADGTAGAKLGFYEPWHNAFNEAAARTAAALAAEIGKKSNAS